MIWSMILDVRTAIVLQVYMMYVIIYFSQFHLILFSVCFCAMFCLVCCDYSCMLFDFIAIIGLYYYALEKILHVMIVDQWWIFKNPITRIDHRIWIGLSIFIIFKYLESQEFQLLIRILNFKIGNGIESQESNQIHI